MTKFANRGWIIYLFIPILFLNATPVLSQGVGIGTTNPDPSAKIDITSSSQGTLITRMSSAQRDAIVNPASGLLIFNTTTNCFNFFRNGGWFELCGNCVNPAPPQVSAGNAVCEGGTINLQASGTAGAAYIWTGPNGFTSNVQNPVLTNVTSADSGLYSAAVVLNGCTSATATALAVVYGLPVSTFTYSPTSPDTIQAVSFFPDITGTSYSWTFQGGSPSTSTIDNPSVTWTNPGTYPVSLTLTDQNGCTSTTTRNVKIFGSCSGSVTFAYTGSVQQFTVPSCVTSISVEVSGAAGGTGTGGGAGGQGGKVEATITVTPGEILNIFAGGEGVSGNGGQGGFNGGGNGTNGSTYGGGGGGGSSDIRRGGTSLADRIIVAGGGGGGGADGCNSNPLSGGTGGGITGGNGAPGSLCNCNPSGQGGSQSSGGTAGSWACATNCNSTNGTLGTGGNGNSTNTCGGTTGGGGGGGGYYGGGGGGLGAGGGGSSFTGGATNVIHSPGVQSGNGIVIITW